MKITIQGQDYTDALDASRPLSIERKLNEPSQCALWLNLGAGGVSGMPARGQSVAVTGDDGTVYFTGYIAAAPMPEYVGTALTGPQYRMTIEAISDEMLLDQAGIASNRAIAGQTVSALVGTLVERTGQTGLGTAGPTLDAPVSLFDPGPAATWSKSAGEAAGQVRAAYRAVDGVLTLAAIPGAVHPLSEADGSLDLAALNLTSSAKRALANDLTVCGEQEPAAYVTEYFLGDGVTTEFQLGADPYRVPASKANIIDELFNEAAIDERVWGVVGGNEYLSLGAAGLVMQGGNGVDGETLVHWVGQAEMGGTLLLEASGVSLAAGSTGILAGFFQGLGMQASCVAGFQVTAQQGTGAVSVGPLILGSPQGPVYSINSAHQYALRIRVYCSEMERSLATYRSQSDDGPVAFGGQTNVVGARLQFEIQEFVDGVAGMPVTVYDGSIGSLPPACMVVAASSIHLQGTMRAIRLTNLGPAWVMSTPANGAQFSRRIGSSAQAAECQVESSGKLVFYNGSVPRTGEQVMVSYRTAGRAVARQVNAASQQLLTAAGLPPVAVWIGSVTLPAARSSQDCRNAAQALAAAASSTAALWRGIYKASRASFANDVWPGDALEIDAPSANVHAQVVVRSVKVSYAPTSPESVEYAIGFANDWAEDLAIRTSESVPGDAWLPAQANRTVLSNLSTLTVTAISGNTITVNTGTNAPVGGGFEIRRRDFAFNPGEDTDLVMRGAEAAMTFTRASASECYYIRMFDGATPPNYSEFSAALFINLPLAS